MQIDTLNKKTSILADLRRTRDVLNEQIDNVRQETEKSLERQLKQLSGISAKITETQDTILEELRKDKLFTWKTEDATISRKFSIKFIVRDESALIADLVARKLDKEYTKVTYKPEVKTLFETSKFAGVEKVETDFISVIVRKVEK
jgi:Cu2+-containing amine oxidase